MAEKQTQKKWIGLTGGIACGKSAVGEIFESLGAAVIDADQVAREVVAPGRPELEAIASQFGDEFITQAGELNRAKMREHIFADEQARLQLEALLHPAIRQLLIEQCQTAEKSAPYVVAMVPILEKLNLDDYLHEVVVVDAAEDAQLMRLCKRDNMSEESAQAIIKAQASRAERIAMADVIIRNNNTLSDLTEEVQKLHHRYTKPT